ncbi:unnamed protein product [Phaedon cochleariae]|uniref:Uncharacterized protein n=1 Tax=Phaedon cochleariae TaxID=80249 RepID=A0A9P0DTX6_PHACE|nr:unnamed protein product [Phaedon cochleariae]
MIVTRLFFLFTLYHLSDGSSCPSTCNCTENAVSCMNNGLTVIPNLENLDNNPTIIDLSGNNLNEIGPDDLSFDKTLQVKEIYLNNSEVIDISCEAFDEMDNLQELYLGENLLNNVPEDFVEDLPNLLLLELSGNQFSGNMPIIKSTSLEVLSLANSKITNVTADALRYLPNLKMLLLQQNNIKIIDPEVFERLPSDNFSVKLSYNAWECNCETAELFEYLARKNYIDTDAELYRCYSVTSSNHSDIFQRNTMKINRSICVENHGSEKSSLSRERSSQTGEENYGKESELIGTINHDKPYALVKEDSNSTQTDDLEIVVCDKQNLVVMGVHLGLNQFLIIVVSFLMGIFIGFSTFQCWSMSRYRKLDTSDSTAKLII